MGVIVGNETPTIPHGHRGVKACSYLFDVGRYDGRPGRDVA